MSSLLYAYAFFPKPSDAQAAEIQSIMGMTQPIQVVADVNSSIAAAVEPLADPSCLNSSDEIFLRSALRHDQVICQLSSSQEVLPLQFGTCFLSSEKLLLHLSHEQTNYQKKFSAIRGRAEYMLKAFVISEDLSLDLSLSEDALERQVISESETLEALWPTEWSIYKSEPQGSEILRLCFLLSPQEYEDCLRVSSIWMQKYPHWILRWSTALPPYHFMQPSLGS
jgi:hypothetical protein